MAKIVHLSSSLNMDGGASKAAMRIHEEFLMAGWDSKMIGMSLSSKIDRLSLVSGFLKIKLAQLIERILHNNILKIPTNFSSGIIGIRDVLESPIVKDADIIALYWVNGSFLDIKTIGKIMKLGKPVIWRLSDMWAFTGGCHYSHGCTRYIESCGSCPQLQGSECRFDISKYILEYKRRCWRGDNLTLVTPSSWLYERVGESKLFKNAERRIVKTTVDCEIFKPIEKTLARQILNIDNNKKILLFCATGGLASLRKGANYLHPLAEILELLDEDIEILVIGQNTGKGSHPKIRCIGCFSDVYSLAVAYNSADIFLSLSLEDNLPNTVLEAMACGIPTVGFDIGGIKNAIIHNKNGLLSTIHNIDMVAEYVRMLLEDKALREQQGREARKMALNNFSRGYSGESMLDVAKEMYKASRRANG